MKRLEEWLAECQSRRCEIRRGCRYFTVTLKAQPLLDAGGGVYEHKATVCSEKRLEFSDALNRALDSWERWESRKRGEYDQ